MRIRTRLVGTVIVAIHVGALLAPAGTRAAADTTAERMSCDSTETAEVPGPLKIGLMSDRGRREVRLLSETGSVMLAVPATFSPDGVVWNAFVSDYWNFVLDERDRAQIGYRWCCVATGPAPVAEPFKGADAIGGSIERQTGRTVIKAFVLARGWHTTFVGTCSETASTPPAGKARRPSQR